jgi:hypothetical protein
VSPRKKRVLKPTGQGMSQEGPPIRLSAASRVLILFEQMQGRFDAVLDAVAVNRRVLEDRIEQLRSELKSEIAVLTSAVRHNSGEIRQVREQMERKAERAELALLDHRVTVLERRVGIAPG